MYLWIEILLAISVLGVIVTSMIYWHLKRPSTRIMSASGSQFLSRDEIQKSPERALQAIRDQIEQIIDGDIGHRPSNLKLKSLESAYKRAYFEEKTKANQIVFSAATPES